MNVRCQSMGKYLYDEDPLLSACGISIEKQLMKFDGRVLEAPKVLFFTFVKFKWLYTYFYISL